MNNRQLLKVFGTGLIASAALAIFVAERKRPLRRVSAPDADRRMANIALGAGALAAVTLVEQPLTRALSRRIAENGGHPLQRLPRRIGDLLAFLLLDYTTYWWHVATHRVPLLWRFHIVHHVDRELDMTTALRFHVVDMLVSTPIRLAQVALSGARPPVLEAWRRWFFLSVLFHHSNVRLPERAERLLSRFVTTPRMHGIHHSAVRDQTDSNWSSGLAIWDHLHRSFRLDVDQADIVIGVPAYRSRSATGFRAMLKLPFVRQRDAWTRDGASVALRGYRRHSPEPIDDRPTPVADPFE